ASVAAELEKSQQAVYWTGEERPSSFIVLLQNSTTDGPRRSAKGKDSESIIVGRSSQREVPAPQISAASEPATEARAARDIAQANAGRMLADASAAGSDTPILFARGPRGSNTATVGGPALEAPAKAEAYGSPVTTSGIEEDDEPAPAPLAVAA